MNCSPYNLSIQRLLKGDDMGKLTATLFLFFIGTIFTAFGQTVNTGTINSGPYGSGSSIAVPIKIEDTQGKLKTDNVFKLYLSDANGSFAQAVEIGSYPGFYTTFINGLIPAGLAPGDYKVIVKYAGETLVSQPSNSFSVVVSGGVKADIEANTNQTLSNAPKTFGDCKPERPNTFRFTNSSTPGALVSLIATNEMTSTFESFNFAAGNVVMNAEMTHYTLFVKAELNGIIGTKAFFLINNVIKPGFSAPANSTVCLPAELQYDIETKSVNGIQNNFPGYSYQINWGDGQIEDVTPNNIIASNAQIKHTYTRSSCGRQIKINDINYYNVYGVIYQVNSPYCGLVSVPISTQSKVLTPPENRFAIDSSLCINTEVVITNYSLAGDNPSSTSPECSNGNNVYYWYVDDVLLTPQGVPITYALNHTFTTSGFHRVRLESQSFSSCEALPTEKTVYVQTTTLPSFNLSETKACIGATIKATDTSILDDNGSARNIYQWEVDGPVAVTYLNGTQSSDKNPEFKFEEEGIYIVKLTIISPCSPATIEKMVIINNTPTITTNWSASLCGKGQLFTFDDSEGNPMQTAFTGTANTEADTYNWEISGGRFSFKNSSDKTSKSPAILFEDYGTYHITITHQNNCGTNTITRTIVFNEAPTISAGADQTVCANEEVTLNGSIIGDAEDTFSWLGGEGLFAPSRNVLNATYLPSANEIAAGAVQLKLLVNTKNPVPCDLVEDLVLIKINPENKVTSVANKTICNETAVNYTPTSVLEDSDFTWTVTATSNASGFSASGVGDITDILTCIKSDQEASVTYIITPNNNGCDGTPFELKVLVNPVPKITAVASNQTICSGKQVAISLTANFADLRYTWTSVASDKISGNSQNDIPKTLTQILDKLTNTGDSTEAVTYTIIPENAAGCAGEAVLVTINVSASAGITTFSPDKTMGCSPLKIAFKNTTKGSINTYYWDFGDGETLVTTDNNTVNHTYVTNVAKTITAKLVTETDCGSYASEFIIRVTPNTVEPELVVNGNEYEGCAPHTVKFFNNSKGAVFFKYDFGDGTLIEGNQSPETISHTFTQGGTYVVKLTASNGCSDTTTTETIKVYPQAITDFSADVTGDCDSVTVKFQNESKNAIAYLWDFGDGAVSTDINPVHTFTDEKANYTITLLSYSAFGCAKTIQKVNFIQVGETPKPDFVVSPGVIIQYPNYRFTFKNNTVGDIKSYLWDFGDGKTSTSIDTEHSYPDTGIYKVQLTAINQTGCSNTTTKTVKILGVPGNIFIPNAFMPNSLVDEIKTFRAKGSGLAEWHFRIFNKWGELIWQTTKLDEQGRPTESWDGTMFGENAPQGIYFWEVGAKFINGTEWAGMVYKEGTDPKKAGTLNLIR